MLKNHSYQSSPQNTMILTAAHFPGDMYRGGTDEDESEEPAWVSSEREQFTEFRDKNKDGVMDEEEVTHL